LRDGLKNTHCSPGDLQRVLQDLELSLTIAKEIRDKKEEAATYGNLGSVHSVIGDFKKSIEYHEQYFKITKEMGNLIQQAVACGSLGDAYLSIGDKPLYTIKTAIHYYELQLEIGKKV